MSDLKKLAWPLSQIGEAIEELARRSGYSTKPVTNTLSVDDIRRFNPETASQWIVTLASNLGLEAELVETPYFEIEKLFRRVAPAILRLPDEELLYLAVLESKRNAVTILATDHKVYRINLSKLRQQMCCPLEAPLLEEIDSLLHDAGVPRRTRKSARSAILQQRIASSRIGRCWILRLAPSTSFWKHVRAERLPSRFMAFVGAYVGFYFLWLLSWWAVGRGALQGNLDKGWILAWALLLFTLVPIRLLATWSQGDFAIGLGRLLKQRLLYGALRLSPEEIRHQGAGQLLGRVLESEAVESLSLTGGLFGVVALFELMVALPILISGAGGWLHAFLLFGWMIFALLAGWRYFGRRIRWTESRLNITHDLVESMIGHRTRLAQQSRELWHDEEDHALSRYLELSEGMDRKKVLLVAVISRGWLALGIIGLMPVFVNYQTSPTALAVGLGGTLLAYRAFKKLTKGMVQLSGAIIAWQQVSQFFYAAGRPEVTHAPLVTIDDAQRNGHITARPPILSAHDLVFRYRERSEPVLNRCSLQIRVGDQLLLQGHSGCGKSTLISLLTGLRVQESGLILFNGLDRYTLGSEGWRRKIACAPQFHDNHILTGTFAFNLLMGRQWPPSEEDLQEARSICHELGLGELLDRMPSGLMQMIGETGWQLSHGERSRLYIARALLQKADLVIFDESFAALDPENLKRSLRCVLDRAPTVLLIAHP